MRHLHYGIHTDLHKSKACFWQDPWVTKYTCKGRCSILSLCIVQFMESHTIANHKSFIQTHSISCKTSTHTIASCPDTRNTLWYTAVLSNFSTYTSKWFLQPNQRSENRSGPRAASFLTLCNQSVPTSLLCSSVGCLYRYAALLTKAPKGPSSVTPLSPVFGNL